MKTSETVKHILPAFLAIQNDMRALVKDRENPFASSKYVTLDNILENLKPLLSNNGLILIQNPIVKNEENATWVGVETKIYHRDGEWIDFGEFLLSFEKGSKMNLAQSAGSLTSYAKRYVLTAVFSISTNEDTDGVYESNENNKMQNKRAPQQQQQVPQQQQQQQVPQQPSQPSFNDFVKARYAEIKQLVPDWNDDKINELLKDKAGVTDLRQVAQSQMIGLLKETINEIKAHQNKSANQKVAWGQ